MKVRRVVVGHDHDESLLAVEFQRVFEPLDRVVAEFVVRVERELGDPVLSEGHLVDVPGHPVRVDLKQCLGEWRTVRRHGVRKLDRRLELGGVVGIGAPQVC